MTAVPLATSPDDSRALELIEQRHGELTGEPAATSDRRPVVVTTKAARPHRSSMPTIPHAIRHATVFGALDAIQDGATLNLLAPHDPIPLLAQIEQRSLQIFEVDYLESGPDTWRLRFSRRLGASPSG